MDWQIRIAIIVIGLMVIGFIFYDYSRRKHKRVKKQRLTKKNRGSGERVDNLGFDSDGVGKVRKSSLTQTPTVDKVASKKNNIKTKQNVNANRNDSSINDSIDIKKQVLGSSIENKDKIGQSIRNYVECAEAKVAPTEQLDIEELDEAEFEIGKVPDLVFSLILKAASGKVFLGCEFMPIFLSQGLRHGDMGIFHRYTSQQGKRGSVLYSVANAINPGTFDIKAIENFTTPAFAFFMTVPGPKNPLSAYEGMVKTIQLLKKEFGGQVLDDSKSVFTEQTYQHHKDLLQDYLTKASIKKTPA